MHLGNWQLDSVSGGTFRMDGGVMFGVVPKPLWRDVIEPDERNRVLCANRCVLARDGRHTVLIDTGYGGKYSRLDRKFYDMQAGDPLLCSLEELGVAPDDVDTVVFSHLHFDHVGGATQLDETRELRLTFTAARHVAGRQEWQDATSREPELQTAYPLDEILPLQDAITLVDDGDQVVPGLSVRQTGGHTRGHLSLVFQSCGETAVFVGDICPSTAHLRRMWHLAYDTYPLQTRRYKPALLGEAADHNWWLLWYHDPTAAASRIVRHPKREFVVAESRVRL